MYSQTKRLISKLLINLQTKTILRLNISPQLDCFIGGSCRKVRFLNTCVHTINLGGVEGQHQITIIDFIRGSLHINRHFEQLLIHRGED